MLFVTDIHNIVVLIITMRAHIDKVTTLLYIHNTIVTCIYTST